MSRRVWPLGRGRAGGDRETAVFGRLLVGVGVAACLLACSGGEQDAGRISAVARTPRPEDPVRGAVGTPQILFGDLHVHTTYSLDAFFTAMPILGGEGAHPPADACDFARHCAALDFFAITDHAQEITPAHWTAEKEAMRTCNAVGEGSSSPDLIAFQGFEWTQIGRVPETHYGHKNVIFRDLEEARLPVRPIGARGPDNVNPWWDRAPMMRAARWLDPVNWSDYQDFGWMYDQLLARPTCPADVHTRDLPPGCMEVAATPDVLFRKLDELGVPSLVIPHGTAWGTYTPPTSSWAKQLAPGMHDPVRQRLIEVMSGHGNSERYQSWREFTFDVDGEPVCPPPSEDYLPCCWQAGEIMRGRCGDLSADECEARVEQARQYAMAAGTAPDGVFPGTGVEDWLDCGQVRGGFKPAYGLRPLSTVQYALSLSRDREGGAPERLRFGLVASSDNHTARPGTGWTQTGAKQGFTDMIGPRNALYALLLSQRGKAEDPARPQPAVADAGSALTVERLTSFLYPGGLVAVHADERSRDGIWDALYRREVYGTSGPRILLWFDLLNGPGGEHPMGSEVVLDDMPRFRVRAMGSFEQKPGCPESAVEALSPDRVQSLCLGDCYYPGDSRRPIEMIEVVRIQPQVAGEEGGAPRIEDPWRRLACVPDEAGCVVEFEDPEFPLLGRDTVYYVRALQEPTPAINGDNLRSRFDAAGRVVSVDPCVVGAGERPGDGCLADVRERAWSSPIFVDWKSDASVVPPGADEAAPTRERS